MLGFMLPATTIEYRSELRTAGVVSAILVHPIIPQPNREIRTTLSPANPTCPSKTDPPPVPRATLRRWPRRPAIGRRVSPAPGDSDGNLIRILAAKSNFHRT